jgi:hypothetical protein
LVLVLLLVLVPLLLLVPVCCVAVAGADCAAATWMPKAMLRPVDANATASTLRLSITLSPPPNNL